MGMMIITKLSFIKKICSQKTLSEIINIYNLNKLNYRVSKFFKKKDHNKIVDYMINDKKNNDKKINLILLKKIGKTTQPGKHKYSIQEIKKIFKKII